MKINTKLLQDLVSRSIKGSSDDKMLPLTSMMQLEVKDKELTLVTSDGVNTLYVKHSGVDSDDFYVVTNTDQFVKLIQKITSEEIELLVDNKGLHVNTKNGKFIIELPLDVDGSFVKYPNPLQTITNEPIAKVKLATLKNILQTNKSALAKTYELPCYMGYYIANKVYSTDTCTICCLDEDLGLGNAILLNPNMMELVNTMILDDVAITIQDDKVVFDSGDVVIYGSQLDGIEEYQIDAIDGLVNIDFTQSCKVDINSLLAVLDRLSLFVGPYDKNNVVLTFDENELSVTSKNTTGAEKLEYITSNNISDTFVGTVDIISLQEQLKSFSDNDIEIFFGLDNAIKLQNSNTIKIIALTNE